MQRYGFYLLLPVNGLLIFLKRQKFFFRDFLQIFPQSFERIKLSFNNIADAPAFIDLLYWTVCFQVDAFSAGRPDLIWRERNAIFARIFN